MSAAEKECRVVAVGTWLYDGVLPREIELLRDTDPGTGEHRFTIGGSTGTAFTSIEQAKRWADRQDWGPVSWRATDYAIKVPVFDDDDD